MFKYNKIPSVIDISISQEFSHFEVRKACENYLMIVSFFSIEI